MSQDHAHHVYNISKMFSKHLEKKNHFDNIIEMFKCFENIW